MKFDKLNPDMSLLNLSPLKSSGWGFLVCVAVSLIVLFILRQLPQLDMAVSEFFFSFQPCKLVAGGGADNATRCGVFPASFLQPALWVRQFGNYLPRLLGIGLVVWSVYLMLHKHKSFRRDGKLVHIALISLLLGPVIIVNGWLKSFTGRARPFQTTDFGGDKSFSLPGDYVTNCSLNCSFSSGEAAGAFWLLVAILFIPKNWRLWAGAALLVYASTISGLRVAFGRHYFSDVVMSACISVTCIILAIHLSHHIQNRWGSFPGKPPVN